MAKQDIINAFINKFDKDEEKENTGNNRNSIMDAFISKFDDEEENEKARREAVLEGQIRKQRMVENRNRRTKYGNLLVQEAELDFEKKADEKRLAKEKYDNRKLSPVDQIVEGTKDAVKGIGVGAYSLANKIPSGIARIGADVLETVGVDTTEFQQHTKAWDQQTDDQVAPFTGNSAISDAFTSVAQNLPMLALSISTGNPYFATMGIPVQAGIESYAGYRNMGYGKFESGLGATMTSLAEHAGEMISIGSLLKGNVFKYILEEQIGESLTETINYFVEAGTLDEESPANDYLDRMTRLWKSVPISSLLMGGISKGVQRLKSDSLSRQRKERLKKVMDEAAGAFKDAFDDGDGTKNDEERAEQFKKAADKLFEELDYDGNEDLGEDFQSEEFDDVINQIIWNHKKEQEAKAESESDLDVIQKEDTVGFDKPIPDKIKIESPVKEKVLNEYEFQPNKLGGQTIGNKVKIVELTEDLLRKYSPSSLKKETYKEFLEFAENHPEDYGDGKLALELVSKDGGKTWNMFSLYGEKVYDDYFKNRKEWITKSSVPGLATERTLEQVENEIKQYKKENDTKNIPQSHPLVKELIQLQGRGIDKETGEPKGGPTRREFAEQKPREEVLDEKEREARRSEIIDDTTGAYSVAEYERNRTFIDDPKTGKIIGVTIGNISGINKAGMNIEADYYMHELISEINKVLEVPEDHPRFKEGNKGKIYRTGGIGDYVIKVNPKYSEAKGNTKDFFSSIEIVNEINRVTANLARKYGLENIRFKKENRVVSPRAYAEYKDGKKGTKNSIKVEILSANELSSSSREYADDGKEVEFSVEPQKIMDMFDKKYGKTQTYKKGDKFVPDKSRDQKRRKNIDIRNLFEWAKVNKKPVTFGMGDFVNLTGLNDLASYYIYKMAQDGVLDRPGINNEEFIKAYEDHWQKHKDKDTSANLDNYGLEKESAKLFETFRNKMADIYVNEAMEIARKIVEDSGGNFYRAPGSDEVYMTFADADAGDLSGVLKEVEDRIFEYFSVTKGIQHLYANKSRVKVMPGLAMDVMDAAELENFVVWHNEAEKKSEDNKKENKKQNTIQVDEAKDELYIYNKEIYDEFKKSQSIHKRDQESRIQGEEGRSKSPASTPVQETPETGRLQPTFPQETETVTTEPEVTQEQPPKQLNFISAEDFFIEKYGIKSAGHIRKVAKKLGINIGNIPPYKGKGTQAAYRAFHNDLMEKIHEHHKKSQTELKEDRIQKEEIQERETEKQKANKKFRESQDKQDNLKTKLKISQIKKKADKLVTNINDMTLKEIFAAGEVIKKFAADLYNNENVSKILRELNDAAQPIIAKLQKEENAPKLPTTKDENDDFRVFYHGTGSRFDNFVTKEGYPEGFSFSSNRGVAERYSTRGGNESDANVKEVYLNVKNPFNANDSKAVKKITGSSYADDASALQPFIPQLRLLGYDSILYQSESRDSTGRMVPTEEWIVFDDAVIYPANPTKKVYEDTSKYKNGDVEVGDTVVSMGQKLLVKSVNKDGISAKGFAHLPYMQIEELIKKPVGSTNTNSATSDPTTATNKVSREKIGNGQPTEINTITGSKTVIKAGNMRVKGEWAVSESNDIGISMEHGDDQQRLRNRKGTQAMQEQIKNNPDPEQWLEMTPASDRGAPVVDLKKSTLSGNGRVDIMRWMWENKPEVMYEYTQMILDDYEMYGFTEEQRNEIDQMDRPILYRQLTQEFKSNAERKKFLELSNKDQGKAKLSPTEIAKIDADKMEDDMIYELKVSDKGEVGHKGNRDFVLKFIDRVVSVEEHNEFYTEDGKTVSSSGLQRMKAAIFAKAYNDPNLINLFTEDSDNSKNIVTAMLRVAGDFLKMNREQKRGFKAKLSLNEDLSLALLSLRSARAQGITLEEYWGDDLFSNAESKITPAGKILAKMFEQHKRSVLNMQTILKSYIDSAMKEDDPNQGAMFADNGKPKTKESILKASIKNVNEAKSKKAKEKAKKEEAMANQGGFEFATGRGKGTGRTQTYSQHYDNVSALEFPEIVELFALMANKVPRIKTLLKTILGEKMGQRNRLTGEIDLNKNIFDPLSAEERQEIAIRVTEDANDEGITDRREINRRIRAEIKAERMKTRHPDYAAKILAHEIGHLVSKIVGDKVLTAKLKNNIIGKLVSLYDFGGTFYKGYPGGEEPLTQKEIDDFKDLSNKLNTTQGDKWIDEIIYKTTGAEVADVLAIWNGLIKKEDLPDGLYDYVARLNAAEKKSIMKDALKGRLSDALKIFTKKEAVGTRKVKVSGQAKLDQQQAIKDFTKMIEDEIIRRQLLDEMILREELVRLTEWWFDELPDPKTNKKQYANATSSEELFADAFSALIGNPVATKALAPMFYRGFFAWINTKPSLVKAYEEIQDKISSGNALNDFLGRTKKAFEKGDKALGKANERTPRVRDSAVTSLFDSFGMVYDLLDKVKNKVNSDNNPRYAIEEMTYTGSQQELYMEKIFIHIEKELNKANIPWENFGIHLLAKRSATDESWRANPMGWNPKRYDDYVEFLKKNNPKELDTLNRLAEKFNEIRQEYVLDIMEKSRVYDEGVMEILRENDSYATYKVIKYITENYGDAPVSNGGVFRRIGTLQEVVNPATATMSKDIQIISSIKKNVAKRKVAELFMKYDPENIKEAAWKIDSKGHKTYTSAPPGKGLLMYMYEGEVKAYYVDHFITTAFQKGVGEHLEFASKLGGLVNTWFRKAYVTANPGFQMNNIVRDLQRFRNNIPNVKWWHNEYMRAIPNVVRHFFGTPDAVVEDMKQKNMLVSVADHRLLTQEENQHEALMAAHVNTAQFKKEQSMIRKVFSGMFRFLERTGQHVEMLPKVAGYKHLKKYSPNLTEAEIGHIVRTQSGSPDFLRKGNLYSVYNNLFLFSNAIKEGYRGDYEAFSRNKTEFMQKQIVTTLLPKTIMFALAMGLGGRDMEEFYRNVSEYDMTNYTCIPIGMDENGKTAYFRLPSDELSRFVGGVYWKSLNMAFNPETKSLQQVLQVLDYGAGQIPSFAPLLEIANNSLDYIAGRNPIDAFRGKNIIPDTDFEAGGWDAFRHMAQYYSDKLGFGIILNFKRLNRDNAMSAIEDASTNHFIHNTLGRFVKVSDYGTREKIREELKDERKIAGKKLLAFRRGIKKLVNGDSDITNDEAMALIEKGRTLPRNLMLYLSRKYGNVFMQEFMSARSKQEQYRIAELFNKWRKN